MSLDPMQTFMINISIRNRSQTSNWQNPYIRLGISRKKQIYSLVVCLHVCPK